MAEAPRERIIWNDAPRTMPPGLAQNAAPTLPQSEHSAHTSPIGFRRCKTPTHVLGRKHLLVLGLDERRQHFPRLRGWCHHHHAARRRVQLGRPDVAACGRGPADVTGGGVLSHLAGRWRKGRRGRRRRRDAKVEGHGRTRSLPRLRRPHPREVGRAPERPGRGAAPAGGGRPVAGVKTGEPSRVGCLLAVVEGVVLDAQRLVAPREARVSGAVLSAPFLREVKAVRGEGRLA